MLRIAWSTLFPQIVCARDDNNRWRELIIFLLVRVGKQSSYYGHMAHKPCTTYTAELHIYYYYGVNMHMQYPQ